MNPPELTWHQVHGIRRRHALRHHAAHIVMWPDYIATGRTLCGRKNPRVTIDPEHRTNPANLPCARCSAAADKLNLPTVPTR
jgi:hypothetical protein